MFLLLLALVFPLYVGLSVEKLWCALFSVCRSIVFEGTMRAMREGVTGDLWSD